MAWFIRTLEIAAADGTGTGRFRLTATSDEDGGGPWGLCEHEHRTAAAADRCPQARAAAKAY